MAPSRVGAGRSHSSSSSAIFFQESNTNQNTYMSTSFGNPSNSLPGMHPNFGQFSGDAINTMLNSARSSGPSIGESSLVTDANSELSGGPNLQRSASINTDSYMRLPASPMPFSSNNISISGKSIIDGLSLEHQSSFQDSKSQLMQQNQLQQGASSLTSLPTAHTGQVSLQNAPRFVQDPFNASHVQKKPRLDSKQEDIVQQHFIQQLLQRQDSMQFQASNPQLQALVQQQRLRQQQQHLLQSMPPAKQTWLLDQQQMQLRQQLQQQGVQSASCVKRPIDGGVCSRRVMQYLYHQRHRPAVSISFGLVLLYK